MIIRKAKKEEFKEIAPLMLLAMDEFVFELLGTNSKKESKNFLYKMIQKNGNQYSYENIWIAELENQVVAMANIYDGGKLRELREPIINELKTKYQRDYVLEDETEAGEHYIDSISVNPNFQGQGIGSKFLKALIDKHVIHHKRTLGLLVDKENVKAKKLYIKHGFSIINETKLGGKCMEHLQLKP